MINCFCQLVIFLYLLDSDTSFVVLASSGIGTAIEFWKARAQCLPCSGEGACHCQPVTQPVTLARHGLTAYVET
jgi:hypothetical protein